MNGGEVIFKFLGDDKELKNTMKTLGSIGKTALAGMVARNYCGNGRVYGNGYGKC